MQITYLCELYLCSISTWKTMDCVGLNLKTNFKFLRFKKWTLPYWLHYIWCWQMWMPLSIVAATRWGTSIPVVCYTSCIPNATQAVCQTKINYNTFRVCVLCALISFYLNTTYTSGTDRTAMSLSFKKTLTFIKDSYFITENQNCMHKKNQFFASGECLLLFSPELLSSHLLSKNTKIKKHKTMILSVILKVHECETFYFILMEEYWPKVFMNVVLKTVLGHKGKDVT